MGRDSGMRGTAGKLAPEKGGKCESEVKDRHTGNIPVYNLNNESAFGLARFRGYRRGLPGLENHAPLTAIR